MQFYQRAEIFFPVNKGVGVPIRNTTDTFLGINIISNPNKNPPLINKKPPLFWRIIIQAQSAGNFYTVFLKK